jgi:hypothetical protein
VPFIGHSAKSVYVESCPQQSKALGKAWHSAKSLYAKCLALGKARLSAKTISSNNGHPAVTLCRVPVVRHLAKSFFGNLFLECPLFGSWQSTSLPSAFSLALGKEFYFFAPKFFCGLATVVGA